MSTENKSLPLIVVEDGPTASALENVVPCTDLTVSDQTSEVVPAARNPVGEFWDRYCEALDKNPIPVKSATSFFGFLIGDLLAQTIAGGDYEFVRTFRMVLFGVLMDGPIGENTRFHVLF